MKFTIELDEKEIRAVLAEWINERFGTTFRADDVPIQVKSKQNYRSEWEQASIRILTTVTR